MPFMSTNMVGQTFGRLTVINLSTHKGSGRNAYWDCLCTCGNHTTVRDTYLRTGHTRSCGCLRNELSSAREATHGLTHSPEYKIWKGMRQRCNNPNDEQYKNYGERGITICERWNSFDNFLADMGPRPGEQYSIDRINNNGNYEPDNCRWTTRKKQANNTRKSRLIAHDGETHTIAEWAEILNVTYNYLYYQITSKNTSIAELIQAHPKPVPSTTQQ